MSFACRLFGTRDRSTGVALRIHRRGNRPARTNAFTSSIMDYCDGFATFPHRGARRDDIRPGLRIVGFRRRVTIAFTIEENAVNIVGVFHGGQDYEQALTDD